MHGVVAGADALHVAACFHEGAVLEEEVEPEEGVAVGVAWDWSAAMSAGKNVVAVGREKEEGEAVDDVDCGDGEY